MHDIFYVSYQLSPIEGHYNHEPSQLTANQRFRHNVRVWAKSVLGTSANCGLKVLACGFANQFLTANIYGKIIEICTYRKSTTSLGSFLQFQKKMGFYDSMYRQIWVDVFLILQRLSPSQPRSSAVERLFPRGRASERKFSRGYEGRYRAPKSYWALQALSGPMPLNHFLLGGCRSLFKSEGLTIFAYS